MAKEESKKEAQAAIAYTEDKKKEIDESIELLRKCAMEFGNEELLADAERNIKDINENLRLAPTFSHTPQDYKDFFDLVLTQVNGMIKMYNEVLEEKKQKDINEAILLLKEKSLDFEDEKTIKDVDNFVNVLKEKMDELTKNPDEMKTINDNIEIYNYLLDYLNYMIKLFDDALVKRSK
jgi:DNA-binding transcriptional regulator GbsR (MarR family)